jgi:hypothetical protein
MERKQKENPFLDFLQQDPRKLPSHLAHVPNEILTKGYAVVPSLLSPSDCQLAIEKLWDFVQDTSGNVVNRSDIKSWYPPHQLRTISDDQDHQSENVAEPPFPDVDPWPHTGYSSFPDMFQSLGAGYLLGHIREILAEQVFEPLFGTNELHSSKEGFTFARPSVFRSNDDNLDYKFIKPNPKRPVCGKVQHGLGGHYDQSHLARGLCTIQSSVCFLDQNEEEGDGHFVCWPHSHSRVHTEITKDIYRDRLSWVPPTKEEIDAMNDQYGISPEHMYAKAGDVIIWRSDLIHAPIPPGPTCQNMRAVGYVSMSPACWSDGFEEGGKMLNDKFNSYKWGKTGDHRSFVESWHDHKRDSSRNPNACVGENVNWVLMRQRPYYRYGPPKVTKRLAELYGLIRYGVDSENEYRKEVNHAIVRGVRFFPDGRDDGDFRHVDAQLCTARTETINLSDGSTLSGQDKFLGGMCSPCGRYIFGVPGHAKRVLRLNTKTNEMDQIGPSYPGQFKWLRGLEVPVEAMGDDLREEYPVGCCLALPSNASCILKINPESGEVKTFGDIIEKGWLYHGGNLAADGFVYAVPGTLSSKGRNESTN